MNNNGFLFDNDESAFQPKPAPEREHGKWKVIIADDEEEVHQVTKLVLSGFSFSGKKVEFISAFSGAETKKLVEENPDTAVILLDVVMESDSSGLDVVKYIRDDLKNSLIRIILRTGQPGQAPERQVISDYDINDYKEKTELTAQKLFTALTTSLRSYRDLKTIEDSKKGLEDIIKASVNLFIPPKSISHFAEAVLNQLTSLLHMDESLFYYSAAGFAATNENNGFFIIAGTGKYKGFENMTVAAALPNDILAKIEEASQKKQSLFFDDEYIAYFKTIKGSENILYLKGIYNLSELDKNLLRIFSVNIAAAFDNIILNNELIDTQKEIVLTLGEVVETRSKETANHVRRVAEYSKLLALKSGVDDDNAELIRLASPMHDVGKIGIPDSILNKPAKLTSEEFELVKKHPEIGYEILKASKRKILQTASIISLEHHEKWDGSGYPKGLKGEEISLAARITALVDVFDALSQKRVYKNAWAFDDIISYIRSSSGIHFDPNLVDIFLKNIDEVIKIKAKYPDESDIDIIR